MYLTYLALKDGTLHLRGIIPQNPRRTELTLSDFMLELEKGIFKNVALVTTRKNETLNSSEFEIKCEVD
jgi:hypothetical protein